MTAHITPNKITGVNAGGPRPLPLPALWVARIAQLTLGIHYIKNNMKALFTLVIGFGLVCASFGGSTDQATSPELLFSRTYKVSTDTFVAHLKHLLPPKSGETDTELLVRFFKQKDVEVKPPESVFLNEQMGMLFARATKSDQDKIEKLVEKIVLGKDVPVS